MTWCRKATSHCLNQCWPSSMTPYDVTRLWWANINREHFPVHILSKCSDYYQSKLTLENDVHKMTVTFPTVKNLLFGVVPNRFIRRSIARRLFRSMRSRNSSLIACNGTCINNDQNYVNMNNIFQSVSLLTKVQWHRAIIGSDNALSPLWCQAIKWINVCLLLNILLRRNSVKCEWNNDNSNARKFI